MSQYPGGQPPQDPYYYGQPPTDPYAPPPQQPPSDPYFSGAPGDPYAQQQQAWYAQQQAEAYAQQQAWYAQQQAAQAQEVRSRPQHQGGTGAAIVGIFLVVLGVWFLFRDEIAVDLATVWPTVAVILGVLMVIGAFIPRRGR